jgi:hypothetical protein
MWDALSDERAGLSFTMASFTDSLNYVSSLYNFGTNRTQITISHVIVCLSVAAETCVNFAATLWFLQAYPLLRKHD